MAETTIKKMLKNFGLTDTEAEVYLVLSKYGASKGTQVAKQTKKDKSQIYHALKNLVLKGLAESTLESPVRYTAVAFENVVESAIKTKQEEAIKIQNTKQELLDYWKNLSKQPIELPIEKFAVIEGRPKVYARITQMLEDTKKQIVTITTVPNLIRAEQFGLYDVASKNPLKSQIQFRFITDFSEQDVKSSRRMMNKMLKWGFNFKGKTPELGQSLFPQMVIRDGEEAVFFINPIGQEVTADIRDDICLWTNCKSLVQAFGIVFEDLWRDSKDLRERVDESKTKKSPQQTCFFGNSEEARQKYCEMLKCSTEAAILTSTDGLIELDNMVLKDLINQHTLVRIMAPITSDNIDTAKKLSEYFEVRHIPVGYTETTIIDGKHLFQFKNTSSIQKRLYSTPRFENTLYTKDTNQVEKTGIILKGIWEKAQPPLEMLLQSIKEAEALQSENTHTRTVRKMYQTIVYPEEENQAHLKKHVLDNILEIEKYQKKLEHKGIAITYSTNAQAVVHPPNYLGLPDMLFHIYHIEKYSTGGSGDTVAIYIWLNTPMGYSFVPSAVITDNSRHADIWKKCCVGSPAENNVSVVKQDEISVRFQGDRLFAGWTGAIQLAGIDKALPPSFLLIESYGSPKTLVSDIQIPSGYTLKTTGDFSEAFVTFLHPTSKYSGPGTDGVISRDTVIEWHPQESEKCNL